VVHVAEIVLYVREVKMKVYDDATRGAMWGIKVRLLTINVTLVEVLGFQNENDLQNGQC
jgi:hypothetical protein